MNKIKNTKIRFITLKNWRTGIIAVVVAAVVAAASGDDVVTVINFVGFQQH